MAEQELLPAVRCTLPSASARPLFPKFQALGRAPPPALKCSPLFTLPFLRYDHLDMLLPEELHRNGLSWTEVLEAGCQAAPPSPPPMTELFPDMRIAVFRISPG